MENDLVSLYEKNYLQDNLVQENKQNLEDDDEGETKAPANKKFKKSMKKSKKSINPGAIYADSFKQSENIFDKILKEMDELGDFGSSTEESDDVFGASDVSDDASTDDVGSDEQTFTLSELKNMTLGELVSMLGGEEEEEEEDYSFDDGMDVDEDDDVPSESYGFSGGDGNYKGDQGNYDGKAKKQPSTSHVKGNGDTNFSKAKTNVKTSSGKKDKNYF